MVRRTKEQALATRDGILDAAEQLFQARGVSGTSLHAIASAAGVTRGAVYWHFRDKGDLFNAMMDRVCLPLEASAAALEGVEDRSAVEALRAHFKGILDGLAQDRRMQNVFDIATHKVEYVDELSAVRERHLQVRSDYLDNLERVVRTAQRRGEMVRTPSARQVALGLHALLDGLIQNWVLAPASFDLRRVGRKALDVHLAGLLPRA
jgi:TetR/AcrR family acrAB operon transcriptional repressor